MKVFAPLKPDHPLVSEQIEKCPACKESFQAGQRIVLVPLRTPLEGCETVQAVPVHATCALKGMKVRPMIPDQTSVGYSISGPGLIENISDGDGTPFPVKLEDGRQYKLEEVGLDGE